MQARSILPPSIPSNLIQTSLLSYSVSWSVISLAYLLASRMLTPPLLAALGLIQIFSPGATSNTQHAYLGMSRLLSSSKSFLRNLCSCITNTSTLGINDVRKHISLVLRQHRPTTSPSVSSKILHIPART